MIAAANLIPMQRAAGVGRIEVREGARTSSDLVALAQSGSAKVRFCRTDDGMREAVLINTAGGLTGGDRFDWEVVLQPGARLRTVTQACEKIYRSAGAEAQVTASLRIGEDAALEWLPQETILFDGARLRRRFEVEVARGGRLLAAEAVILGRKAMGEDDVDVVLRDRWRVRRAGELVFADDIRLAGCRNDRDGKALLGGAGAFASVLLIADDAEARLDAVRARLGETGGASAFDGKLFCRFLDTDGAALRRRLAAVIGSLRDGRALPRLWTV